MARKDLLKKAFRNNFLRKSVADLKSFGTEKARQKPRCASSTSLRSMYEDAAPALSTPPTSTNGFPAQDKPMVKKDDISNESASSLFAVSEAAKTSRESVAEWLHTVPKDAAQMSSSEVRREIEKADAVHKDQVLRNHEQLLSAHCDLVFTSQEILVSHLDTIDTTLTLLEVMEALSPHAQTLRQEMLDKKHLSKAYSNRHSLLELTTCLEIHFVRYALIKPIEVEFFKAQIETYTAEVDLLRQENVKTKAQKDKSHEVETSGEGTEMVGRDRCLQLA
ncbi:uncharacterized protein N0V89_008397 [Didymosphaeria variabile]|uniref:Uncharacterized protein n=1 Tax=Didymosphaeria variabile TaxID=1932322 RepID=A0A9W8XFP1_9PLEO|nr:uncharacterized protein N0V89_008397 [Didymosphaeria variabile]KAJ4349779.1 hypothetical protein N0V89_008397 [Didymosphaeria variabile]